VELPPQGGLRASIIGAGFPAQHQYTTATHAGFDGVGGCFRGSWGAPPGPKTGASGDIPGVHHSNEFNARRYSRVFCWKFGFWGPGGEYPPPVGAARVRKKKKKNQDRFPLQQGGPLRNPRSASHGCAIGGSDSRGQGGRWDRIEPLGNLF